MVRFALLIGASLFLVLLFLSENPNAHEETRDLQFKRGTFVATATTSTVSASSTLPSDEEATSTATMEVPDASEKVSTSTQKIKEVVDVQVSATSISSLKPAVEAERPTSLQPQLLNEKVRSALVNILCEASAPLRSTSGSGVIVDSRGIILTNAHIAQHFLLEGTSIPVSCTIRSGSPARATWHAKLVFIPEKWVNQHAKDIVASRAMGTGEHDYALLAITDSVDGSPLPASFPSVSMNLEESASVTGDLVLVAGYPAEFVGGSAARNSLHASTVFSSIKQLLTFTDDIVDVISVGGTALAQSGSSGGGFIDLYGTLVGLIVTTSVGDTTGSRDLHAITPAHIDRSIRAHTGASVKDMLSKGTETLLANFSPTVADLSKILRDAIESQRN